MRSPLYIGTLLGALFVLSVTASALPCIWVVHNGPSLKSHFIARGAEFPEGN